MASATAPASAANLGPGFDSLALAIEMRCSVSAVTAPEWSIEHVGPECPAPGAADAVLRAAQEAVGFDRSLRLTVDSRIPLARGLGSSAAAYAAGSLAAWRAGGIEPDILDVFRLVGRLEGHPDNSAAVVFGGLVAVGPGRQVARLDMHPGLLPIVAVPKKKLLTSEARAVVPAAVPREVAIRSLQRAVFLVEGLRKADAALLAAAAGDELHEAPRAMLNPLAEGLMEAARNAGALHACWSGSGPSVLALSAPERRGAVAGALNAVLGDAGRVLTPDVAHRGVV